MFVSGNNSITVVIIINISNITIKRRGKYTDGINRERVRVSGGSTRDSGRVLRKKYER